MNTDSETDTQNDMDSDSEQSEGLDEHLTDDQDIDQQPDTESDLESDAESDSDQESEQELINALALPDDEVMELELPEYGITGAKAISDNPEDDADDADDDTADTDDNGDTDVSDTDSSSSEKAKTTKKGTAKSSIKDAQRIFEPFKANGTDISVKSADEAISLMQQGANYSKKMEQLAPHMKMLKTLERAKISPENIDFLIDLHNKDPQAIKKLVSDSDIDPMDIDVGSDEVEAYKPNDHQITDKEFQLDQKLESLKTSDHYTDVVRVVGNEWDESSRHVVANNPQILDVIEDHMSKGFYPLIEAEVVRQKALGTFTGVTDLAAYQQVGDSLNEQGAFNHLTTDSNRQGTRSKKSTQAAKRKPMQRQQSDQRRNAQRRAAAPTASTSTRKATNSGANPLSVSDDEFEKQFSSLV